MVLPGFDSVIVLSVIAVIFPALAAVLVLTQIVSPLAKEKLPFGISITVLEVPSTKSTPSKIHWYSSPELPSEVDAAIENVVSMSSTTVVSTGWVSIEIVGNTVRSALSEFIGSLIAFGVRSFGS